MGKEYPTFSLRLSVKGDDTVAPITTGLFQIYARQLNVKSEGKQYPEWNKSNKGAGPSTTPPPPELTFQQEDVD